MASMQNIGEEARRSGMSPRPKGRGKPKLLDDVQRLVIKAGTFADDKLLV